MRKILIILFFMGVILISGCNGTQGNYLECPREIGDFCAQVYEPVCGDDGNTYSNGCVACQNVKNYKPGECE